jgi:hypothetical protein
MTTQQKQHAIVLLTLGAAALIDALFWTGVVVWAIR